MTKHRVFFIHGDPSVRALYAAALAPMGDVDLFFVNCGAYSSAYRQVAAPLKDDKGRTFPRFEAKFVPTAVAGRQYDSTSIITFSAGYAMAEALLTHPLDRQAIDAYVALDSAYDAFDANGKPALGPISSLVEYARQAKSGGVLYWLGYTDVHTPRPGTLQAFASSSETVNAIVTAAGGQGGNLFARHYPKLPTENEGQEHGHALTQWGPGFAAEALIPYLGNGWRGTPSEVPPDTQPSTTVGERLVAWYRAEQASGLAVEIPPGSNDSPRLQLYGSVCRKRGTEAPWHADKAAWCAKMFSYGVLFVARGGEPVPAPRVSGIELEQDAEQNGTWYPVDEVRAGNFIPRLGDCCILQRGAPGSWERHVTAISTVFDTNGTFLTFGGNEDNRVKETMRHLSDPDILGFIAIA